MHYPQKITVIHIIIVKLNSVYHIRIYKGWPVYFQQRSVKLLITLRSRGLEINFENNPCQFENILLFYTETLINLYVKSIETFNRLC